MFPAIIILKVITALLFLYRLYIVLKFRNSDKNVRLSFDLLSYIEIDMGLAITVIALLANAKDAQGFTIGILLLAILLNVLHLNRTVIAGDQRILIGRRSFDLRDIRGMNASRITLHIYVKGGEKIDVVVPLSKNETIRKMKYIRN